MAIPFRQQDELRKRIEKFFLLIAAFYVVLLLRLVYLQAVQGAYFHNRATSMREEQIPLKAQRGSILDREGKPTGAMGVEQSFDSQLRGSDGFMQAELDARRRPIPDTQKVRLDSKDGDDIRLTIDSTIQHMAEEALAKTCAENHPDSATAIV